MKRMRPVEARFRLVQGGFGGAARFEVLGRIRTRWGGAAVEEVRERVEAGTDQEAEAWLRRSAYFLDLPAMLDLERTLPVAHLRIHDLLGLLAADERPTLSLIFLRFSAPEPRAWRLPGHAVPWLKDIPQAAHALQHLCAQGWLLIGCGHRTQGLALWKSVLRGRGIRASRYELAPSRTRGSSRPGKQE